MRYNFSSLPDKLPYPPRVKAILSTIHSDMVEYVSSCYAGTFSQRRKIIQLFNTLSYHVICGNNEFLSRWNVHDMFNTPTVSESECRSVIGSLYIIEKDVNWDIEVNSEIIYHTTSENNNEEINVSKEPIYEPEKVVVDLHDSFEDNVTPKEDLYIQSPSVPRFDVNKIWAYGLVDNCKYVIYTSLPEVPTKQNEISVTTDVTKMSDIELMKLYPTSFIRTRSESMYQSYQGLVTHSKLGVVLPIDGFKQSQIIDNIIKYPHIYRLTKDVDGKITRFYTTIEIHGQLYPISDVWKELPDTKNIPYTAEFVKEYVVRRYLLERDVLKIEHRYPLHGTLDPFLTLFTTSSEYVQFGYSDVVSLAKMCVKARVSYKQSRNPVLQRLNSHV